MDLVAIGNRIRQAREAKGWSQEDVAKIVNLSPSTVSQWENGGQRIKIDTLAVVAQALECSVDWLLYGKERVEKLDTSAQLERALRRPLLDMLPVKPVPLLGTIRAGWDHLAQAEWEDTCWVPADSGIEFCLQVTGDSMVPEVYPGEIVCCRRATPDHPAQAGDIVVVMINGDEGTLKRLRRSRGQWILHAANPAYPDHVLTSQDDPIIQAVVLEIQRKPPPDREQAASVAPPSLFEGLTPEQRQLVENMVAQFRKSNRQGGE